jgi:hypothetical protein
MGTLTPAYGKDYKNRKDAVADFDSGKDFVYNTYDRQTYCTKKELLEAGIKSINIRFKNNTEIAVVKL